MSEQEITNLQPNDLSLYFIKISSEEILRQAFSYTEEQIRTGVTCLTDTYDSHWKKKLQSLFEGITDRNNIEVLGKSLNLTQTLALLDVSNHLPHNQIWKLGPLLLGIPYRLFGQIIATANSAQLETLKQETASESIQHHLVIFIHEITRFQNTLSQSVGTIVKEIDLLDYKQITLNEVELIFTKLQNILDHISEQIEKINIALELAWKTGRPDIVDNLSSLKENSLKFVELVIGNPRTESEFPSGIYKILEDRLSKVFGNNNELEQLQDNDSVIDALNYFGLKYIDDYKQHGLFPNDSNDVAINKIGDLLDKCGLKTVKDLKIHNIFSLDAFKKHLEGNLQ